MVTSTQRFPTNRSDLLLAYVGMETDLIFNRGIDLPGFASYPLLESADGQETLRRYFSEAIELGRQFKVGTILESPTWMANLDRARDLGYGSQQLADFNRQALELMARVRAHANSPFEVVLSANIGPARDAYAPSEQMTVSQAQDYHQAQIAALANGPAEIVSGYTLAYSAEATGIALAARAHRLPVVISFTVETDGRLPTGETLEEAISQVDDATDGYVSYFMINCAHPQHFANTLEQAPWMLRVRGIVANASLCSHAELDEATELDDGDPVELGAQLAELRRQYPQLLVLGGCCGTDLRHMTQIAEAAKGDHKA